jgi:Ca-activated chloride channel family protein
MLMVFGRYGGKGAAAVKISGVLNGEKKEFVQDVNFADSDTKNTFIPRLWATRRVGWMLDEIRLHGETKELKDEVVRLAREHGIVTPYTAYLILEDERSRNVPVAMQNFRELATDGPALREARDYYGKARAEAAAPGAQAGGVAVDNSRRINDLKSGWNEQQAGQQDRLTKAKDDGTRYAGKPMASFNGVGGGAGASAAPADQDAEGLGYKIATNYAQQARVVNGRAFYQNQNVWNDSTAQAKKDLKTVEVKFNSDAYFDLLKKNPDAAAWLSLGDNVDVVIGEVLYQVRG